jgi:uncharacterized protein (DUF433 family)
MATRLKLPARIEVNPKVMLGKPVIKGTRIPVYSVLELLADGVAVEQIIEKHYPSLKKADIKACIKYAVNLVNAEWEMRRHGIDKGKVLIAPDFDAPLAEFGDKKVGEQRASYKTRKRKAVSNWSFPNIEIVKFTGGPSAVIRGTRISVHILIGYLMIGETPEKIVEEIIPHITLSQVYEAIRYYFVHRAEIDKEREENTEEAGRRMLRKAVGEKKYREITGG